MKNQIVFDKKQEQADYDSNIDANEYFRLAYYLVILDRSISELQKKRDSSIFCVLQDIWFRFKLADT